MTVWAFLEFHARVIDATPACRHCGRSRILTLKTCNSPWPKTADENDDIRRTRFHYLVHRKSAPNRPSASVPHQPPNPFCYFFLCKRPMFRGCKTLRKPVFLAWKLYSSLTGSPSRKSLRSPDRGFVAGV